MDEVVDIEVGVVDVESEVDAVVDDELVVESPAVVVDEVVVDPPDVDVVLAGSAEDVVDIVLVDVVDVEDVEDDVEAVDVEDELTSKLTKDVVSAVFADVTSATI